MLSRWELRGRLFRKSDSLKNVLGAWFLVLLVFGFWSLIFVSAFCLLLTAFCLLPSILSSFLPLAWAFTTLTNGVGRRSSTLETADIAFRTMRRSQAGSDHFSKQIYVVI